MKKTRRTQDEITADAFRSHCADAHHAECLCAFPAEQLEEQIKAFEDAHMILTRIYVSELSGSVAASMIFRVKDRILDSLLELEDKRTK